MTAPGIKDQPVAANSANEFYAAQFSQESYVARPDGQAEQLVRQFVADYELASKRVLEIGCGRGWLQDIVADWTGVDIVDTVRPYIRKPFFCASADALPFPSDSFDAIWSIHVLEHVPALEQALAEIQRVLRPGGVALLKPAWFCRSWAAEGYAVRPWRDLGWYGKLVKASIPLRNSVWFRLPGVFCKRAIHETQALFSAPTRLHHGLLRPNYEVFWQADSDACNSIDPHDLLLWFASRGWRIAGRQSVIERVMVRGGGLVLQKPAASVADGEAGSA